MNKYDQFLTKRNMIRMRQMSLFVNIDGTVKIMISLALSNTVLR